MKKILLIIIIIAAGIYLFYKPSSTNVTQDNNDVTQGEHPDPSEASFTFDGEVITLKNGSGLLKDENGFSMETKMLDEYEAYGDINADSKKDTVLLLAQSGGGSGVFIYVAAYVSGPINYKGTNAIFLGDRVSPQSTSISNGVITVNFLDRKEDEPFAAEPTVPTFKRFEFKNGELVEK